MYDTLHIIYQSNRSPYPVVRPHITSREGVQGSYNYPVADMIKFMTKTGVLTRSPIYPEGQISPKRTWKRDLDELQSNNEDQPKAKQRKITDFGIPQSQTETKGY